MKENSHHAPVMTVSTVSTKISVNHIRKIEFIEVYNLIVCNECGHLNDNSNTVCEKCGFDLTDSQDFLDFDTEEW